MKTNGDTDQDTSIRKPKSSRKSAKPKPSRYKVELVHVLQPDAEDRLARTYAIIIKAAVRPKAGDVFTE